MLARYEGLAPTGREAVTRVAASAVGLRLDCPSLLTLSRGLEGYFSLSANSATRSWAADRTLDSIARDLAS